MPKHLRKVIRLRLIAWAAIMLYQAIEHWPRLTRGDQ